MGKYVMQDFEGHLRACGCLSDDEGNVSVGSWRIMESVYFCQGKFGRERKNGDESTCKINGKQSGSTTVMAEKVR